MSYSDGIKMLRLARGWTQGELCRRTGMERAHISRLEAGNIKNLGVNTALRISRAFGISVEDLCLACGGNNGDAKK